ncbi:MAG: hypothetical protein KDD41_06975 [Flavobacteriales bacterium]|nr:hypothetical protein [Flavobacteriales bacterium]
MKKITTILLLFVVILASCDEESQNQIANLKTVSNRIQDLGKSKEDIKAMEDPAALMQEDDYYLEYEYPIRENESYVTTYRFMDDQCFEIKLDTYLDKENYAKKVQQEVMTDMANNKNFGKTSFKEDVFLWTSTDSKTLIQLKTQNIERGTVNLVISLNK